MKQMSFHYVDERLDIIGLGGVVVVGVVVGVLSLLMNIGQYGFALAFLLAAGIYAGARYNGLAAVRLSRERALSTSHWPAFLSQALCLLFLLGAIAVLSPNERPPAHFVLITLAFGTVLFDITWTELRRPLLVGLVVTKLVLVSLVFRTVRFFVLATIPGFDTQAHLLMASQLAETGSFPADAGRYSMTPVWHLYIAGLQRLGLHGDAAVFLGIVVVFTVVTTAGAYLLGRDMIDRQGGLYAALLVSVSDMFLLRGLTNITPSAIVVMITIVVFYLLYQATDRPPFAVYGLVTLAYFTHQLSSFILLVLLWALWGGQQMYDLLFDDGVGLERSTESFALRLRDVVILVPPMLLQWSLAPVSSPSQPNFLLLMGDRLWDSITGVSSSDGGGYAASLSQFDIVSNLLYTMGYSMLLVVGVFGLLLWLHPTFRTRGRFGLIVASGAVFTMVYPLTLVGLGHLFLPHRILVFLEIFLAIFGAAGIRYLYGRGSIDGRWLVVSGFLLLLIFFMLTTPFLNRSDPVYEEDRVTRTGLTEEEVTVMQAAAQRADSDRPIYVDGLVYPPSVQLELYQSGLTADRTIRNYPSREPIERGAIVVERSYFRQVEQEGGNADINTFGLEPGEQTESYRPEDCTGSEAFYSNSDAVAYEITRC